MTPLVTIAKKNGQRIESLFTMGEYHEFRKKKDPDGSKFVYTYMKGLGSLSIEDWDFLFQNYKLEDLMLPLHLKDSSDPEGELEELRNWLSGVSQFRKDKVQDKIGDFDINAV